MKSNWEKLETNQGVLTVEVEAQRVAEALDQAFKKVVKQVQVPGFRKGKVPRAVFEARFGVEALYQDALDILLPQAYAEAVEQTQIEPVDQPEVDIEQFEKGKDFIFKAKVTVKPEVQLGAYTNLEIEDMDTSVSDEEVEAELATMRNRVAQLVPLEADQTIENGDQVRMDFEGFIDGEPFEGGKAENYLLEVGAGSLIPGFEEQLVGMRVDEEKEIQVTFPEDYHAEELKGKEATFKVHIRDAKRKILPELDDEFAKDVSEFETLQELREDIKKRLQEQKEHERQHHLEDEAVNAATANATVEIPEVMVHNEVHQMIHNYEQQLRMQGLDLETYHRLTGTTHDDLHEQFHDTALQRVKSRLVLEAIWKKENIQVSQEELDQELQKMADTYQRSVEEMKALLGGEEGLEVLERDIRVRKTLEFLVENSRIVPPKAEETAAEETGVASDDSAAE